MVRLGDPAVASVSMRSSAQMFDTFCGSGGATVTLTDQLQAAAFLNNDNGFIHGIDLTNMFAVRLVVRVTALSASVNTPKLKLSYITAFGTTIGSYSDIGTSEVSCSLAATGLIKSSWIPLATGAKADVFTTITSIGGNGSADPAVGIVQAQFRDYA